MRTSLCPVRSPLAGAAGGVSPTKTAHGLFRRWAAAVAWVGVHDTLYDRH
jgi:hypothetical protein